MLDKKIFLKCVFGLLTMNDVKPDDEKTKLFYDLMKNDFTDDEFQFICEKICKEENLYGKYPPAVMFYKYKTNDSDKCSIECQNFLDKVEDYLNLGFVPSFYKEEFIKCLTDTERRAMQGFGGISTLWGDCHRDDMPRSKTSILRELRESFQNTWELQTKVDVPMIEHTPDPKMIEKTRALLGTFKLGGNS